MFLLDTDTCSYALRDRPASVRAQLIALDPDDVAVSAITAAELTYGAERHPSRRVDILADIDDFLSRLTVVPWSAATEYGRLRTHLEKLGRPIGGNDLLIAAHALALDATLVTHNHRHFKRVPGLRIETWA